MDNTQIIKHVFEEIGHTSLRNLYNHVKDYTKEHYPGRKITEKECKAFRDRQEITQIHKQTLKNIHYIPIIAKPGVYQMDLTFYSKLKDFNEDYTNILCCINIMTRKAYTYLQKTKTGEETFRNYRKFIQDAGDVKEITSDNGPEFVNKLFKDFNAQHHIIHMN